LDRTLGSNCVARLTVAALALLALDRVGAAPIDPNNILVSVKHSIREFTPGGTMVQVIPLNYGGRDYPGPPPNPPREDPADIVVDQYGWIDCFNGYWNPFLTRYSPVSNTFTHKTFPGWSRINSATGGIAAYQNFVFATDKNTSPGVANGIVRFDIFKNTAARFANGIDFNDLNIGLDGKLYAVASTQADIYVYEPTTMQLLRHIAQPLNIDWIDGIAADQSGQLFVACRNGTVYRLDSNGTVQASKATGFTWLTDIDIDEAGRLIVAQWNGNVLVNDTSLLNDFRSFLASDNSNAAQEIFVCFAHTVPLPIGPIPTPTATPPPVPTPVPAHDILVSVGGMGGGSRRNSLRQFTEEGLLLRSARFNYNNGAYPGTESLRDIVVDQNGVVNAFNGTFFPLLTRFSWNCNSFTHTSFSGWSTINNVGLGGIAAYRNFIFVSDETTAQGGEASGIIRFDTSNNTATRFVGSTQFDSLSMGLDRKLYASPYFGGLDVYDPITMQLIKHLNVPAELEGRGKIAVDQAGTIFMASRYGTIHRLDNNMVLQASTATGFPHLLDIDIEETGRIVAVSDEGWVIVGDASLNSFSWFRAIDDLFVSMFSVAFAPLSPTPPVQLVSVVSEKRHGDAGTFAIDLPIDGNRGVECRSGGQTGDYSMIFTFAHNLLQVGGLCSNGGSVTSAAIDQKDTHRYIVNLTGVKNASYVTVTLTGVSGSEGTYSGTVSQEMGILLGDTGGNGSVSSADFSQTRPGQPVWLPIFREDTNANGYIDGGDTATVQSQLGTALPSLP
jgi:hypothetical protein